MDEKNPKTLILVVDDDPNLLRGTTRLLRGSGYDTMQASTGNECLELALENKPDLILLDVMLPDLNGFEVCRKIKTQRETSGVYVVLISSLRVGTDDRVEGLDTGADAYIARPVENRELLAAVRSILRLQRTEKALRESEQNLKRTFDESPVGAAVVAMDYRFLRVNAELCRMTGYSAEELLCLSMKTITHPADNEEDAEQVRRLLAGEIDGYRADRRFVRKDGDVFWGRLSVGLVRDASGQPSHFLPMIEDINARKLVEQEKEKLLADLQEALAQVKKLGGLLPICASCKKIRDDSGYWQQIESYIRDHSEAEFSHSICPECAKRLYPEYFKDNV